MGKVRDHAGAIIVVGALLLAGTYFVYTHPDLFTGPIYAERAIVVASDLDGYEWYQVAGPSGVTTTGNSSALGYHEQSHSMFKTIDRSDLLLVDAWMYVYNSSASAADAFVNWNYDEQPGFVSMNASYGDSCILYSHDNFTQSVSCLLLKGDTLTYFYCETPFSSSMDLSIVDRIIEAQQEKLSPSDG